jgi:4-nitrophenyl phosphatase
MSTSNSLEAIKRLAEKTLTQESRAIATLKDHLDYTTLSKALRMILETTGMTLVAGAGTSSSIARRLAHVLTCSGGRAVFLDPGQSQHGYSALISPDDLVIAFSRGGETQEVNHVLRIAQQIGSKTIGILEDDDSTMASLCDVALIGRVSPDNDAGGVIPLASTLAHAAIGDILCAGLLEARGIPESEFGRYHPGGAVGLRLGGVESPGSPQGVEESVMPLATLRGLILDMDGVLWHGDEPLEGLEPFFKLLSERQIRYVLATNNPSKHPEGFAQKARSFGISIETDDVINSVQATVYYLQKHFPAGSRVHVIGETALKERIANAGFELANEDVAAVVAALERGMSYETIKRGALLIRAGATFIGTNGDTSYPTEEGIVPGSGMMVAALAASADQEPIIIGKPETPIFDLALERLGLPPDQVASVGDRLDSDILGGQRAGIHTILLLTGITTREDLAQSTIQPTWIFEDLPELTKALRNAGGG